MRTYPRPPQPVQQPGGAGRFAVLLNANAKRVKPAVQAALARVIRSEDLFLSRTEEDADAIAGAVLERGYRTVFAGGGDGTFVGWVNRILDRAARDHKAPPRFGVLALGTGNAVAELVGARPSRHIEHLAAFGSGAAARTRRLELLSCKGRRTPFAGTGIDASVLADYDWLKGRLGKSPISAATTGIPGYALSVALRSAPRYLVERRAASCEIVNEGARAWRLDGSGRRTGRPAAAGDVLYSGPCMMAAASTVPFYGFGLKAFPFADRERGMFQLRVVTRLSVPTFLWNLGSIFAGEFRHPGVLDFHAERVSVRFAQPMPLQLGGDSDRPSAEVTFGMAPDAVELVDFRPAAPPPRLVT